MIILGISPWILGGGFVHSEELQIELQKKEKKYTLSVCAFFKNEGEYLKEWVEYHRLIGVDHFYLYNHSSLDHSSEVLAPYIQRGIVSLIYWPNFLPEHLAKDPTTFALSTRLPAYENGAKYAALNETEWLILLEVDEFIVPVVDRSIKNVLKKYEDHSGVLFEVQHFCASRKNSHVGNKLVIESLQLIEPEEECIQNELEKVIFRPEDYGYFTWPPYKHCFFEGKTVEQAKAGEFRINKYHNRPKGTLHFGRIRRKLYMDNRQLTKEESLGLLQIGYEIEDQERAIFRFVPELKRRMGLETGWYTDRS